MNILEIMTKRPVILPVIHVKNANQAVKMAEICIDAEADGVFIINHHSSASHLNYIYDIIKTKFPELWIGVNYLGIRADRAITEYSKLVNGIWTDDAEINEKAPNQRRVEEYLEFKDENCIYFGSICFKYQREVAVEDVAKAAAIAAELIDVVTTSGPATGASADINKIRIMKEAIGNRPLAIASGITPENVLDYIDFADAFLVATGISEGFYEFNPSKLKMLVDKVKG